LACTEPMTMQVNSPTASMPLMIVCIRCFVLLERTSDWRKHFDADAGGRSFTSVAMGICVNTCRRFNRSRKVDARHNPNPGGIVQPISCLRCRREIEAGHKSVAVYMFAQTVGVKPRQKSGAQRICFCPQCAVSLAMGMPPEGALNLAAWDMIRDLVSAEPSLNEAAWEGLRGVVALLGFGDESTSASESRTRYGRAG
jgi:hypothetical protein